jgi:hypothetical protein
MEPQCYAHWGVIIMPSFIILQFHDELRFVELIRPFDYCNEFPHVENILRLRCMHMLTDAKKELLIDLILHIMLRKVSENFIESQIQRQTYFGRNGDP